MKYLSKSLNGQFVQLGEDVKTSRWYTVGECLKSFEALQIGDEVAITTESVNGKQILKSITKGIMKADQPKAEPVKVQIQMAPLATLKVDAQPQKSAPFVPASPGKFIDPEQSLKQTCLNVAGNMMAGIMNKTDITEEKAMAMYARLYTEILSVVKSK